MTSPIRGMGASSWVWACRAGLRSSPGRGRRWWPAAISATGPAPVPAQPASQAPAPGSAQVRSAAGPGARRGCAVRSRTGDGRTSSSAPRPGGRRRPASDSRRGKARAISESSRAKIVAAPGQCRPSREPTCWSSPPPVMSWVSDAQSQPTYMLFVSSLVVVWLTRRGRGPGAARSLFGPRSGVFPRAVSGPRRVGGGGTHPGCRAARVLDHPPRATEEQDRLLRDSHAQWWMPLRGWCASERGSGRLINLKSDSRFSRRLWEEAGDCEPLTRVSCAVVPGQGPHRSPDEPATNGQTRQKVTAIAGSPPSLATSWSAEEEPDRPAAHIARDLPLGGHPLDRPSRRSGSGAMWRTNAR